MAAWGGGWSDQIFNSRHPSLCSSNSAVFWADPYQEFFIGVTPDHLQRNFERVSTPSGWCDITDATDAPVWKRRVESRFDKSLSRVAVSTGQLNCEVWQIETRVNERVRVHVEAYPVRATTPACRFEVQSTYSISSSFSCFEPWNFPLTLLKQGQSKIAWSAKTEVLSKNPTFTFERGVLSSWAPSDPRAMLCVDLGLFTQSSNYPTSRLVLWRPRTRTRCDFVQTGPPFFTDHHWPCFLNDSDRICLFVVSFFSPTPPPTKKKLALNWKVLKRQES